MNVDPAFASIWQRYADFSFDETPNTQNLENQQAEQLCIYSKNFYTWGQEMWQEVAAHPSHITINRMLLQLCKKYWEWYYIVPKRHRNQVGERNGHRCLHWVFKHFQEQIKLVELSLSPPILFEPPPPPPPPPAPIYKVYKLGGIPIGEIEEEEEDEE